jgi:hypothetical protein
MHAEVMQSSFPKYQKSNTKLLKPRDYFTHHQVFNIHKFYMVHTLRLCVFVRISEQTATFVLHNISRLVLYNRGESLLRGTN